jgi:hypothetical protein
MKASVDALADHCTSVAAAYAPADTKRFLLAVGTAKDVQIGLDIDRLNTLSALSEAITACITASRAGAK